MFNSQTSHESCRRQIRQRAEARRTADRRSRFCNPLTISHMHAALQKAAFWPLKDGLSPRDLPPFARRFAAFRKPADAIVHGLRHANIRKKSRTCLHVRDFYHIHSIRMSLFLQHLDGGSVSLAHDVDALLHLVQPASAEVVDGFHAVVGGGCNMVYARRNRRTIINLYIE